MQYANVVVEGRGTEDLASAMDAEMARRAADGWRVCAVTRIGQDGWGHMRAIVTFEKPSLG